MMSLVRLFLRDRSAATAIEYAMISVGVAVVVASAITTMGTNLNALYVKVANNMK